MKSQDLRIVAPAAIGNKNAAVASNGANLRVSGLESGDYECTNEVTRYDYNNGDGKMDKNCRKGVDFLLFCYCVSYNGQYQQAPDDRTNSRKPDGQDDYQNYESRRDK